MAGTKGASPGSLIATGVALAGVGLFGGSLPVIGPFLQDMGFLIPVLIGAGAISAAIGVYSIVRPEKEVSKRTFGHRSR